MYEKITKAIKKLEEKEGNVKYSCTIFSNDSGIIEREEHGLIKRYCTWYDLEQLKKVIEEIENIKINTFKTLLVGERFIPVKYAFTYMKIEEVKAESQRRLHFVNAVNLKTGELIYFKDDIEINKVYS